MNKTNTAKLLDLLTAAVSSMHNNIGIFRTLTIDKDFDFKDLTGESVHLFLSYPCDVVRELYDLLPESIQTEEATIARNNLYVHQYDDDIGLAVPALVLFHFAHDTFQEMHKAMEKYGLEAPR